MAADPATWFRIYDSSPVADIDLDASYCVETSDDGGKTWEYPRPSTGEHLRLDMTDALRAGCSVESSDATVIIHSPHPIGGLIRYTPTD